MGLSAPVEVRRDARSVPHLRAQSLEDVLFAQGYVTAQDRLWQMDLSRRNVEGELSEVLGHRTLLADIDARTVGLPQVAAAALADLSPVERHLLDSYTRGVNAYIQSHRQRLPMEFLALRYQPQPWRPIDSVAVALNLATGLSQSWRADLMRERVAAKLGQDSAPMCFLTTPRLTYPWLGWKPQLHGVIPPAPIEALRNSRTTFVRRLLLK